MLITQNPFPQFFDTAGKPLTDGRVYFGVAGQNPRTSPVAIYTDAAGTQPIAQPVRTLGGYPVRNGSPVNIFTPSAYSVAVYTASGTLVAYAPDSAAFDSVLSATTAFTRTLLDDPDAATARATLGAASLGANTFTGAQTLPGNAVNPMEAVPKQQAESIAAAAAAPFAGRNRIINGTFAVNQRAFAGGALTAGTYGHDRWKAGAGGATYTVTGEVATITAGTLQQVIEGVNVPEGGTYILSWTGTAQARVDGGAYAASPITVTGKTASTNTTVEFGTGTVSLVQYEAGSAKTLFDRRQFGVELTLCQRYYEVSGHSSYYSGSVQSGGAYYATSSFKVTKRIASPTVITAGGGATGFDASNPTVASSSADGFTVVKGSNASNAGGFYIYTWTASAEL